MKLLSHLTVAKNPHLRTGSEAGMGAARSSELVQAVGHAESLLKRARPFATALASRRRALYPLANVRFAVPFRSTPMPKLTYLPTGASFEVPAGTRYMDLCQKEDLPQPFGCTVGSCGTCCLVVEKGLESCEPMSEDERDTVTMCTDEKNARLGCQLVIQGDLALRPIE